MWCSGTKQIRLLAKQCEPPNNIRKYALNNVLAGKLPNGLAKWPEATSGHIGTHTC